MSLNNLASTLRARFKQCDDLDLVTEAGDLYHQALDLCPVGHPARPILLDSLAQTLQTLSKKRNDFGLMTEAADMHRQALDLCPVGHPPRSIILHHLASVLQTHFEQCGDISSIEEAVELYRHALNLTSVGHPDRPMSLCNLALALHTQSEKCGGLNLVTEAFGLYRQALDVCPAGHSDHFVLNNNLAVALKTRFEQLGDLDFLTDVVDLHRQNLQLCPPGHTDRVSSLSNLATALVARFTHLDDMNSLAEAIDLHRHALVLCPAGHSDLPGILSDLGATLRIHSEHSGDIELLAEAIALHCQAVDLRPLEHPKCARSLGGLASALCSHFERHGDLNCLAGAVSLYRQALNLRPLEHPSRSDSLEKLAYALKTRFDRLGDFHDLTEAVDLHRQALRLRSLGHPYRHYSLTNLANALHAPFAQLSDLDLLTEVVNLHQEALALHPVEHRLHSMSLNNLAYALNTQFERLGHPHLLAKVVDLNRRVLNMRPTGHTFRSISLNNLASALLNRFEQLGDLDSLTEAVNLNREALDLHPPGHPNHFASLQNLANALLRQSEQLGDPNVLLSEVVSLYRRVLDLLPLGHPQRSVSLENLAIALRVRFDQCRVSSELEEAVDLHRQALNLRPEPHSNRPSSFKTLGEALAARFLDRGSVGDLEEALYLARERLKICPDGHPERMGFLFTIGQYLLHQTADAFNFEAGIHHIMEAFRDRASSARECLRHAIRVLPSIEAAYLSSYAQASALGPSRPGHDDMVLEVYISVIRLLPRVASFGLDNVGRLRKLSNAEAISRDAATRAIIAGRNTEAVEMLEEGRGVFWLQALRLRAMDLNLLPADEAQKLTSLFRTLESGSMDDESMTTAQRERHVEERRRHSEAAEALIEDIRSRPDTTRFMMPPAFSSLAQSLPEKGFVVILVDSKLGYHVLVLNHAGAQAKSIALVAPENGFFSKAIRETLPRGGDSTAQSSGTTDNDMDVLRPMNISTKGRMQRSKSLDPTLAQLWTSIVKPVVDAIGLKKAAGLARPRLWWCVTGNLSSLPIHAAGLTKDGVLETASDYFVSSYIPTLSALTKARKGWCSVPNTMATGILAASMNSLNQGPLYNVEREIDAIMTCFRQASAQILHSSSPNTSVQKLRQALEGQSAHILHLACHGEQAENPLDSAFLLSDGRLSIQDLMTIRLQDARLAFLSACQTARGSERQPDQAVHLAASMLFCGFRTVVGTMWMMNDDDGPDVARWFYESLFATKDLDLDHIAYALDRAVFKLREKGVLASRWAAFIHIGG